MSTKKPLWYLATIKRIANYSILKSRSVILQDELREVGPKLTPVYSSQPHGSGVSDPTGNQGDRVMAKQRELHEALQELRTIDLAISMLNEVKQFIITEKYIVGSMDKYVFWVLRKNQGIRSRDTYYRLKDDAVTELAKMLGEWKGAVCDEA